MKKPLIVGGIGVVVALLIIALVGIPVSKQHGNKLEHALSAAYDKDRQKLGECIDIAMYAAGYTQQQAKSMENALIAAAGGEGLMGASASPAGFSAIVTKTFPNLKPFEDAFARGFNSTVGCRKEFTQLQSGLITQMQGFRDWKSSPFAPGTWFGDWPNEELEVKDPATNTFIYGKQAWAMVTTIITNGAANSAYTNGGNYNPQNPFNPGQNGGNATPVPGNPGPSQVAPGGNAPLPASPVPTTSGR